MAGAAQVVKETKAQKIERLKRELNPWEHVEQIRQFAREGRSTIPPEWANAYFKWWGIYTQGDGVGAVGGKGGEGLATEYFMMRIGLPNGILRSDQLRAIAEVTKKHARNLADITVRQNIQLHWLTIEGLVETMDALATVGLGPKGACGDVVRNVTGCPLAGVAADEIFDASPLAQGIARELSGNSDFYNLPRKFKITATGCRSWCSYPEINDVALTATERVRNGRSEPGFSLRVGGGLSADPHLGIRLNVFVPLERAIDVVRGVAELFREQSTLRESRERARLKHLFLQQGWTEERFRCELEWRLGFKLDAAEYEQVPSDIYRDHVGIHPQKQPGLAYVGASVLRGRVSGDQLAHAAELSERFGSGELRTTTMQNLVFVNVPRSRAAELARELQQIDLQVDATPFWRGAVACTGTEFCKLAITETKGFARWLVEELESRIPEFDQQLKLHVTGCPNSCGQHWIADIGLEGKKIKHNGKLVDAYYFCAGGSVGAWARTARPVGYRAPATEVPEALERLLRTYLTTREGGENLRAWFGRHSDLELREFLAGAQFAPVERDLPERAVPHGVE
ncbi:MAG TPA: nitrite/sulfite reductase [Terriglobales bacterium]|jgi:sulfite reductase (ferredoxin)|nr:nitrite/sulfite reductase [Terriglobales bacterium]